MRTLALLSGAWVASTATYAAFLLWADEPRLSEALVGFGLWVTLCWLPLLPVAWMVLRRVRVLFHASTTFLAILGLLFGLLPGLLFVLIHGGPSRTLDLQLLSILVPFAFGGAILGTGFRIAVDP